jgi:hypothetical protein
MPKPQLPIEERLDRIELAISMMAMWLVQSQGRFTAQDSSRVERILRGDKSKKGEDKARTEAHERWEEDDASPEEQGGI